MEKSGWFEGPDWLLKEQEWSEQPSLKSSVEALHEEKPIRELVSYVVERHDDELDELL